MRFRELVASDLRRSFAIEVSDTEVPSGIQLLKRFFNPRFTPVFLIRLTLGTYRSPFKPFAKFFSVLNFVLFGIEVGLKCEIGPGLYLPHTMGTVIGARSIGANAMIFQGVTLGASMLDIPYTPELRPILEDGVTIGAGAKVLGALTVGSNAVVGANAVVTRDVPSGVTVVGIPGRPLETSP